MPIIAIILLTFAFLAIYWFVRMGGIAQLRARVARNKEAARRAASRALEQSAPLRAIDDPRDAATVLMLLICRSREATEAQTALIETTMRTVFGFDSELGERLAHARFVAGAALGFDQAGQVFSGLFRQRLTESERNELIDMLEQVASLDGPSQEQAEEIAALAARIDLAVEWPMLM
jgi:hypothetical protein